MTSQSLCHSFSGGVGFESQIAIQFANSIVKVMGKMPASAWTPQHQRRRPRVGECPSNGVFVNTNFNCHQMMSCCVLSLQFVFTLDSNVGIPERPLRQQHNAVIQPRDNPRTATQCRTVQQPSELWELPERHAARDSCNNQMTGKATHCRVVATSPWKLPNWCHDVKQQHMP